MPMKLSRYAYETVPHWAERCLGSGRYPGPMWARFLMWCLYFTRCNLNRWRGFSAGRRSVGSYLERDLIYAAGARCKCGAGLAYPHGIGGFGEWSCSAALKGVVPVSKEHEAFPFAFYEIKSEQQPSASGRTTRSGVKSVKLGALWNTYIRAN